MVASRSISSKLSNSARSLKTKSRPNISLGIQYTQRKLQRSVTEILKSWSSLPSRSVSPVDGNTAIRLPEDLVVFGNADTPLFIILSLNSCHEIGYCSTVIIRFAWLTSSAGSDGAFCLTNKPGEYALCGRNAYYLMKRSAGAGAMPQM